MKHNSEYLVDIMRRYALPDAPMAMPMQVLERPQRRWAFGLFTLVLGNKRARAH